MQDSLGAATILEGLVEAAEKTIATFLDEAGGFARPKAWPPAAVERTIRDLRAQPVPTQIADGLPSIVRMGR